MTFLDLESRVRRTQNEEATAAKRRHVGLEHLCVCFMKYAHSIHHFAHRNNWIESSDDGQYLELKCCLFILGLV